jgi:hypothetical protein
MTIRVQQALAREAREYLALEIVAFPMIEDLSLENEEAGVYPVAIQYRLLAERAHAPRGI